MEPHLLEVPGQLQILPLPARLHRELTLQESVDWVCGLPIHIRLWQHPTHSAMRTTQPIQAAHNIQAGMAA